MAEKHADWVLGYIDEVWWSRLSQATLHSWADGEPLRLIGLALDKRDPDPKVLACYGRLRADTGQMWLCFVQWRPISAIKTQLLSSRNLEDRIAARGVEVDHSNRYRWVQTFTPQREAAFRTG